MIVLLTTHTPSLWNWPPHKKIRVLKARRNGGVAATRNLIINNTNADFIVFFDDDDVSAANRISEQLQRIIACEDGDSTKLVLCHSARHVEYGTGQVRYEPSLAQMLDQTGLRVQSPRLFYAGLKTRRFGACATCSQMARTTTYRKIGGFDENLRRSEDSELSIRAAELEATFVGMCAPLVQQFMTHGNDKNLNIELDQWQYIFKKHKSIIERHMAYSFAIQWLALRHKWLGREYFAFAWRLAFLFTTSPIQTVKKIYFALPNIGVNSAMSNFHNRRGSR